MKNSFIELLVDLFGRKIRFLAPLTEGQGAGLCPAVTHISQKSVPKSRFLPASESRYDCPRQSLDFNVTSTSVFTINIVRYKLTPTKFWDKKLFEQLFETKYDVEYKLLTNNSINTASIKTFKDIEKLIKSPEHYKREYLTDAIRLKPGAKITDFIDVSGFMNIEKIQISGDRWGMVFIRDNMVDTTKNLKMYHTNMSIGKKYADWSNMNTSFPKTDDGWYVVITRM